MRKTTTWTLVAAVLVAVCMLVAAQPAKAVEGARFELMIHQHDTVEDRYVPLYRDSIDLVRGMPATGFLTCLSIDVTLVKVDSAGTRFQVHVYTLAEQPANYAQQYTVEYGLPARLDSLIGKGGNAYRLTMTPVEMLDIDTSLCGFRTTEVGDFKVDPSAYVNIHYVPNTLADYYWNSVRGMLNERFEKFKEMNRFTLPGRYELFLCPCKVWTVIWDKRFAMMADPIRRNLYAVYSHNYNSAYPFVMNHAAILRHYGYAPPFLSEGFAGYQSFSTYDVKKLAANNDLVPLDSLLDTYAYFQHDPHVADPIAASFVKYLIDQYTLSRFIAAYEMADDLTLRTSITGVYDKSIGELEQEWLTYVDTVRVTFSQAGRFRDQAETMRYYDLAAELAAEMLRRASTPADSVQALTMLVRGSFFTGDYYGAIDWQQELLARDSSDASSWMGLAAYEMMSGDYDKAHEHLERATSLDSSSQFIMFNRGLNALYRGDTAEARRQWSYVVYNTKSSDAVLESQVLLAHLLRRSDDEEDRQKADRLFGEVINALSEGLPGARS
ncbi:hypothetical protein GF377_09690, partial [candidate division GN15 bacterium]|nr:hypothetical protein [candidate division GN15 bacterium]